MQPPKQVQLPAERLLELSRLIFLHIIPQTVLITVTVDLLDKLEQIQRFPQTEKSLRQSTGADEALQVLLSCFLSYVILKQPV